MGNFGKFDPVYPGQSLAGTSGNEDSFVAKPHCLGDPLSEIRNRTDISRECDLTDRKNIGRHGLSDSSRCHCDADREICARI
jgi:hypothetical protein